jgi:hypothetical protein
MTAQPARADVELRLLESMVDCAHALGVGFAQAARAEPDLERRMALDVAFHRGFQAVRMGVRLALTLRAGRVPAGLAPAVREARDEAEAERPEHERPERERLEDPPERDRERERDYEPVSLSRFLSSLRGVAADASRLPVQADAAVLPKLEGLLTQAAKTSDAAPAVALEVRPPPPPARARFLGSAAPSATLGVLSRPRPPPHASG